MKEVGITVQQETFDLSKFDSTEAAFAQRAKQFMLEKEIQMNTQEIERIRVRSLTKQVILRGQREHYSGEKQLEKSLT